MAQYIAIAASVMSILGPALKKSEGGSSSGIAGGTSSSSRGLAAGGGSFSSGIVIGLGLGAIVISQLQRRRIMERARYTFIAWLNEEEGAEGSDNDVKSLNLRNGNTNQIVPSDLGEAAMMQVIANRNNSLTPNIHYSKVTLKKGTRTTPQKSKGVEVYYVLVGKANFALNDTDYSSIAVNEYIIVDPWTIRSISNNGSSDLVFLRVSDAGNEESSNDADFIVEKIDQQLIVQTLANGIKTSIQKLGNMATMGSKDDEC